MALSTRRHAHVIGHMGVSNRSHNGIIHVSNKLILKIVISYDVNPIAIPSLSVNCQNTGFPNLSTVRMIEEYLPVSSSTWCILILAICRRWKSRWGWRCGVCALPEHRDPTYFLPDNHWHPAPPTLTHSRKMSRYVFLPFCYTIHPA